MHALRAWPEHLADQSSHDGALAFDHACEPLELLGVGVVPQLCAAAFGVADNLVARDLQEPRASTG